MKARNHKILCFTVGENKNEDLEHNGISMDQQDRQVINTVQLSLSG